MQLPSQVPYGVDADRSKPNIPLFNPSKVSANPGMTGSARLEWILDHAARQTGVRKRAFT